MQKEELIKKCLSLYNRTFRDTPAFTKLLFGAFSDNLYTLCEGDDVASMFFLTDVTLGDRKGGYIYAAATDEKYRRRGYMASLIKRAVKENRAGYSFLCLAPASEKLFGYYEKLGFRRAFYKNETLLSGTPDGIKITDPEEYLFLRKLFTDKTCLEYPKEFYTCAFEYCTAYTDSVFSPSYLVMLDGDEIAEYLTAEGGGTFPVTENAVCTGMIYDFEEKNEDKLYMGVMLI